LRDDLHFGRFLIRRLLFLLLLRCGLGLGLLLGLCGFGLRRLWGLRLFWRAVFARYDVEGLILAMHDASRTRTKLKDVASIFVRSCDLIATFREDEVRTHRCADPQDERCFGSA